METVDWFVGGMLGGRAEISEDTKEVLADAAEAFLRSQGTITWAEWRLLSPLTRAAFEEAGRRIDTERAFRVARLIVDALGQEVPVGENGESKGHA